jgi:hypothetical protein
MGNPERAEEWSQAIAALVADALLDAKLLDPSHVARATEVIAEEIWVRVNMGDLPPAASTDS